MLKVERSGNTVSIEGNIKSMAHYSQIKSVLDDMVADGSHIVVKLIDSISLTSSIIGYFSKLVNVDDVRLELFVNDESLYNLLDDLGLRQTFNIRRLS